jgi:hypothetical protein
VAASLGLDQVGKEGPRVPIEFTHHLEGEIDLIRVARCQVLLDDKKCPLERVLVDCWAQGTQLVIALSGGPRYRTDASRFE